MSKATLNGNEYSDDGTGARDLLNGGHRSWLIPLLQDIVTTVNAINGIGVISTTPITIGDGTHNLTTTPPTTAYAANTLVKAISQSDLSKWMLGTVVSHVSGGLQISVPAGRTSGSGSVSDWIITPYVQNPFPANAAGILANDGAGVLSWLAAASQAEAEAGALATRYMTPQRTAQAIAALAAGAWVETNLLVNFLNDEIGHSVAGGEMQDGVTYSFATDEIGSTSDGETYNSTRDDYSNPGSPALIAGGTGSAIGNMTSQGGLAAAFDGDTAEANQAASCADQAGTSAATVGKDWGSGQSKTVTAFKVYPGFTGAPGFYNSSSFSATVKLQGSQNNSDWTDLYTSGSIAGNNGATIDVSSGITTTTAYRYHRILITGSEGGLNCYLSEVQFFEAGSAASITLMPTATTAQAQPSNSRLLILHDPVDSVTLNTDVKAHVSRDDGRAVTADAGTDKLALASNGFSNGDRVFLTTSNTLPAGLVANKLYHVVGAASGDFQVSLTAGGSAVNITDAGTGTTKVHKAVTGTLVNEGPWDANHNILAATFDFSGLPTGTRMMWIIETLNNKEQRFRGVAQMWS